MDLDEKILEFFSLWQSTDDALAIIDERAMQPDQLASLLTTLNDVELYDFVKYLERTFEIQIDLDELGECVGGLEAVGGLVRRKLGACIPAHSETSSPYRSAAARLVRGRPYDPLARGRPVLDVLRDVEGCYYNAYRFITSSGKQFGQFRLLQRIAYSNEKEVFLGCQLSPHGGGDVGRGVLVRLMHQNVFEQSVELYRRTAAPKFHIGVTWLTEEPVDFLRLDDQFAIISSYLFGTSLEELGAHLDSCGERIPWPFVVAIYERAAAALLSRHSCGLRTRIQPSSVRLCLSPGYCTVALCGLCYPVADLEQLTLALLELAHICVGLSDDPSPRRVSQLVGEDGHYSPRGNDLLRDIDEEDATQFWGHVLSASSDRERIRTFLRPAPVM